MPSFMPLAALAAPLGLALFALAAMASRGPRPAIRAATPLLGALMLLCAAIIIGTLAIGGAQTAHAGPIAVRIDMISVILFTLVAFIGAIVLGFSRTYLDGEARQGSFLGWMALTIAAVLMLVLAGGLWQLVLAWIAMSMTLHRLILFYPDRPGAQRAARKKRLFSLMGDLALVGAAISLWLAFGTADIAAINDAATSAAGQPWGIAAAIGLAAAAVVKSAQFPFHGWLTEVMEAPTPVSALLHAGVINAGGFLLIRFADVMVGAPGVLAALVMAGGLTALFASMVMLTQAAVKTSLAWSTIAQMGFMIFQCGLALFPLALLHIVAHSLYKAHAFLSSGGAVRQVGSIRRPGPIATPGPSAVGLAFAVAGVLFVAIGLLIGFEGKSPQAVALGAILVLGVAYLLAQGFADKAPRQLTAYTAAYSAAATFAYFTLQTSAEKLMASDLPPTPSPGPLEWGLVVLALGSFGLIAIAQAAFPLWSGHPAVRGLRVHLSNGFYINALFDRWLGNWRLPKSR